MKNNKKEHGGNHASNPQAEGSDNPQNPDDQPLFFYMPNEKHGEFCQWYPSKFTVTRAIIAEAVGRDPGDPKAHSSSASEDSLTFNCAEQFMMYCKAARFGDSSRQRRIMNTDSPKEQKALGRQTVGFWDQHWDEVKSEVVVAGNIAKFGQNRGLKQKLLETGERELCEASSRDPVWGIGYKEKYAMQMRKHWGQNLLGKALMVVRARLREMDAGEKEAWEA